ncbi:TonB-dependent receptor plug domain-containing protein [Pelagicoccus mobilis]|uniref:TonB-dependent receptor plug domain-containing protein n=1 Tax=Pelagicoccus mobilis TaxID=415221 RepID=A0A934RV89_9BACT|nr:TonB-dependent receptor plug domain-containing protein [Pelagicoccus mobilis]MBK1876060.1 hypothetical protein [Pelagicoccus mobilis]
MYIHRRIDRKASHLLCAFLSASPFALAQAQSDEEDEIFELSPFTVDGSEDQGYYSSSSLAGGRLSQELKNTGSSVEAVTQEFMDDLGITDIEELLQYTTNTEVGGILGNFTGAESDIEGGFNTDSARRNPDATSRIRGIGSADRTRDYFKTDIPFDSYITGRIDINRGSNSFLFGLGSPAGLVNSTTKRATFNNDNEVKFRIGSGGENPSWRASVNFNRVVLENKLAVRVASLVNRTEYRQRPTFKDDDRLFAAITYQPFGDSKTVLRANFETGEIIGNAPDTVLPQHSLDTFLNNRLSMNVLENMQEYGNEKGVLAGSDQIGMTGTANGYAFVYDGVNGNMPSFAYQPNIVKSYYLRAKKKKNGQIKTPGDPFWDPDGTTNGAPVMLTYQNARLGRKGWRNQGFTNLDTFDFSKYLLGGEGDFYTRDFDAYNFAFEKLLWDGRAGFELAYDKQTMDKDNIAGMNENSGLVTIDINETLNIPYLDSNGEYILNDDGNPQLTPNPNFGRPMFVSKGETGRKPEHNEKDTIRLTSFVKIDLEQNDNWTKWLGNHTVSFLVDDYQEEASKFLLSRNSFGEGFDPGLHLGAPTLGSNKRMLPSIIYLGDPIPAAAWDTNSDFSIGDFEFQQANALINLPDGFSMPINYWNVGAKTKAEGDESWQEATLVSKYISGSPRGGSLVRRTEARSYALNSQSFFFDKHLVLNLGYREDYIDNWLNTSPPKSGPDELPDVSPEAFIPENGMFTEIEKSPSNDGVFGGGVVLHLPSRFNPFGENSDVSFHYNQSDNFVPDTSRSDQYGTSIAPPEGYSKDYGVRLSLFDRKLNARFNWYESAMIGETSSLNALFNQNITNMFKVYSEANEQLFFLDADSDGAIDQTILDEIELGEDETIEQAIERLYPNFAAAGDARDDMYDLLQTGYWQAKEEAGRLTVNPDGSVSNLWLQGITDTQDIRAKGFEAKITYNPTKNWRMIFSAARQETRLDNIAPNLTAMLEEEWLPFLEDHGSLSLVGPAGPTPVPSEGQTVSGNSIEGRVTNRLVDYYATKGQEGLPRNEVREWRFNFVTNYSFTDGKLKGFSIGAATRWQDEAALGYPLIETPVDTGEGLTPAVLLDIDNPYYSDAIFSLDAHMGYKRKLFNDKVNWSMTLNFKNLTNLDSDEVTTVSVQPDGSAARVRFDPPFQVFLSNSFKF